MRIDFDVRGCVVMDNWEIVDNIFYNLNKINLALSAFEYMLEDMVNSASNITTHLKEHNTYIADVDFVSTFAEYMAYNAIPALKNDLKKTNEFLFELNIEKNKPDK